MRATHKIRLYPTHKHQTYNSESALGCPRVQTQMSNKHNLVLYVDRELVEKSRDLGIERALCHTNH
jgi:hypothetical protein